MESWGSEEWEGMIRKLWVEDGGEYQKSIVAQKLTR